MVSHLFDIIWVYLIIAEYEKNGLPINLIKISRITHSRKYCDNADIDEQTKKLIIMVNDKLDKFTQHKKSECGRS